MWSVKLAVRTLMGVAEPGVRRPEAPKARRGEPASCKASARGGGRRPAPEPHAPTPSSRAGRASPARGVGDSRPEPPHSPPLADNRGCAPSRSPHGMPRQVPGNAQDLLGTPPSPVQPPLLWPLANWARASRGVGAVWQAARAHERVARAPRAAWAARGAGGWRTHAPARGEGGWRARARAEALARQPSATRLRARCAGGGRADGGSVVGEVLA